MPDPPADENATGKIYRYPVNAAFGGPDGKTSYLTSGTPSSGKR
ncbi:hypothetical protein [Amycolatopsis sp. FBCC-B4732]|nr:hypothetical protein [Amycolatopsis sp. FBCC-B4732]